MQLARFQRPRASQGFYGNGAPGLPAAGVAMTPPAPTYPRMSTASHTTAPAMPFAPAPIVTNPNITPFQLSLNRQRADEANHAATFAAPAPLPMSNGVYHGAYGDGPDAQKLAEGARAGYLDHQHDTINAQDLGPGIGLNSFNNSVNDAYNQAHPYVSPIDQARIGAIKAWSDNVPGSQAIRNKAAADKDTATAKQTGDLTQPRIDAMKGNTQAAQDKGKAALTAADARAAAVANKANPFNKDTYNAGIKAADAAGKALVQPHTMKLQSIFTEQTRLQSEMGRAVDDTARKEIQGQLDNLHKEEIKVLKSHHDASEQAAKMRQDAANPDAYRPTKTRAEEVQDAGQVAPATQPTSSAGTLEGHDPAKRTPEAIAYTAQKHGISEDEVLKRLGVV